MIPILRNWKKVWKIRNKDPLEDGETLLLDNKKGRKIEINYRFAMDKDDFIHQWSCLKNKPSLKDGVIIE